MARQRGKYPSKNMKPVFLVFCEGETEEEYLTFVRNAFRSPIKIVTQIEGDRISQRLIDVRKSELKISDREKVQVFLMYDMDVPEITQKLMSCQAELLLSNPCVELWFLLHSKNQNGPLTSEKAVKALKEVGGAWARYKKSELTITQKQFLKENTDIAISRAKALVPMENPYTGIYKLIEAIR